MNACKKESMSQEVNPSEFWDQITKKTPYKKWSFWPDHKGMQKGNAPHGPLHKVYVNKLALNDTTPPLPDGAIVVKENYGKDKALKAVTVMKKIKGYNPEGGDWFWGKFSPDGKADKSGKVAGCINCHVAKADNDYVMVHEIK